MAAVTDPPTHGSYGTKGDDELPFAPRPAEGIIEICLSSSRPQAVEWVKAVVAAMPHGLRELHLTLPTRRRNLRRVLRALKMVGELELRPDVVRLRLPKCTTLASIPKSILQECVVVLFDVRFASGFEIEEAASEKFERLSDLEKLRRSSNWRNVFEWPPGRPEATEKRMREDAVALWQEMTGTGYPLGVCEDDFDQWRKTSPVAVGRVGGHGGMGCGMMELTMVGLRDAYLCAEPDITFFEMQFYD